MKKKKTEDVLNRLFYLNDEESRYGMQPLLHLGKHPKNIFIGGDNDTRLNFPTNGLKVLFNEQFGGLTLYAIVNARVHPLGFEREFLPPAVGLVAAGHRAAARSAAWQAQRLGPPKPRQTAAEAAAWAQAAENAGWSKEHGIDFEYGVKPIYIKGKVKKVFFIMYLKKLKIIII